VSPASGGTDPHNLGFRGLLAEGWTPEQAWAEIRDTCQHPAVRAIIADLATTEEGRAALEGSRIRWAQYGLPPPWDVP
jgi:hypothetical protein